MKKKKRKRFESTPPVRGLRCASHMHTRDTRTEYGSTVSRGKICTEIEKDALVKETGTLDNTRLPTKIVLHQQQRCCCTRGSVLVSHNFITAETPGLADGRVQIKGNHVLSHGNTARTELPHSRDVASCSAGGRQACITL